MHFFVGLKQLLHDFPIMYLAQLQALAALVTCCLGYTHVEKFMTMLNQLTDDMVLIYTKEYIDNLKSDPERYFKLGIGTTVVYIIICFVFLYGAYMCNNMLMIPYILIELVRLIMLSIIVATALLVLKQNTMDIGLLIGASVAAGFFLLSEFYLWVCAANLPILVNEIEHDEQAATIVKLQQLLRTNNPNAFTRNVDSLPLVTDFVPDAPRNDVFIIPKNTNGDIDKFKRREKAPDPYINTYFMGR
ncbi:uncharacterized protein LOC106131780 [Amyelois transitella]|uniref:uncharacterized protein LOC106131780 n=1 Tax=Amyelois transitella TaxID=680683 RepID=UPI00299071AD|nr:uncharacterized protein LOC106131780 [Amyelois transitella]